MESESNKWLRLHGYPTVNHERLFAQCSNGQWFAELGHAHHTVSKWQRVQDGPCTYYDCARSHRREQPQVCQVVSPEGARFCLSCAAMHIAKTTLGIPEPLPHELRRQ
jgi:hypothetical protein